MNLALVDVHEHSRHREVSIVATDRLSDHAMRLEMQGCRTEDDVQIDTSLIFPATRVSRLAYEAS